MLEAVDRLAAEAGPDVAAADSAEAAAPDPLTPDQYVDTWNSAVAAGLAECSGRACPSHDSPGAPLAGERSPQRQPLQLLRCCVREYSRC